MSDGHATCRKLAATPTTASAEATTASGSSVCDGRATYHKLTAATAAASAAAAPAAPAAATAPAVAAPAAAAAVAAVTAAASVAATVGVIAHANAAHSPTATAVVLPLAAPLALLCLPP